MLFNTLAFWIFFAVVLGVYLLLERGRSQNVFLLLASYFFYGCWDWRFLALLCPHRRIGPSATSSPAT